MLRRVRLHHSKSSVRPAVCDVRVCFSNRLEHFENIFTAEWLKVPSHIDHNVGGPVQWEHPTN